MTTKLRRTFSILLMICMIISLLPVTVFAVRPKVIYLQPNANWVNDNARFAAFFCGGGNEVWVDMTATDCDGIYECAVPDGYPYVIFCRMNPGSLANNWNTKWNQSDDLLIPTDGNNLYVVTPGSWDWGGGTWHIFEVPTDEEETTAPTEAPVQNYKYYVAGTMNNWATNNDDYGMELVDGVYTVTVIVAAGNYQFKVTDGSWANSWGVNGGHGNIEFVLTEEAEITINFDEISKITTFTSSALGEVETFDYYLVGDMNGWSASSDCGMQKNDDGTYSITIDMVAGTYEYKVNNGAWSSDGGVEFPAQDNQSLTLEADCAVNFTLDVATGTIVATGDGVAQAPVEPPVSEYAYYVAGSMNGWNTPAEGYGMTANGDGTYSLVLTLTAGNYELRVTDGTWDNSWTAPEGEYQLSSGNLGFYVSADSEVTVTFDGSHVYVSGANVSAKAPEALVVEKVVIAGGAAEGSTLGNFLFGQEWTADSEINVMYAEEGTAIYTATYYNVEAGTYEFKFVLNDSWAINFASGVEIVSGETTDAWYNAISNSTFTVAEDGSDVTFVLDLTYTAYHGDYATMTVYVKAPVISCAHDWIDATCQAPKTCALCGQTAGEIGDHSYQSSVTPPGCMTDGYTHHTCSVCGNSYRDAFIFATGHSWLEADCTNPMHCAACGITRGEALGHGWKAVETVGPTCTSQGYTVYHCSFCGDNRNDYTADALGHSWAEATCTAPKTCSICGTTEGDVKHSYTNGFCTLCDAYQPAVLNGDVYEISNAGQLYWFAAQVNSGNNYINGKLMNNIVINENVMNESGSLNSNDFREWVAIGYYKSDTDKVEYAGVFDGNGKTVAGLYNRWGQESYYGMFSIVGSQGAVKNVGVVDSWLSVGSYFGSVVGYNDGTVTNCYNASYIESYGNYVGGVVGYNAGTVDGCYNSFNITGYGSYWDLGGVVGHNTGLVVNCYNTGNVTRGLSSYSHIGGVVGFSYGTVSGCYNTGSVNGYNYTGGIVGESENIVSNCYNNGTVSGYMQTGGIVGENYFGNISECYNTGNVTGEDTAGGIVGYNNGSVTKCYNTGNISFTGSYGGCHGGIAGSSYYTGSLISYCYSTGDVTGRSSAGGVVGMSGSATVTHCYATGNISGTYTVGGVTGSGSPNNCFATGKISGSYGVGGVTGNGSPSNCYYLVGNTVDEEGTVQFGVGIYITGYTTADVVGCTTGMTANQFASGEVAYLLGEAFGQTIGVEPYPVLGGAMVYKNQTGGCNETSFTYVYSNAQAEAVISHDWRDATCQAPKTCSLCGATEGETYTHNYEAVTTPPTCTHGGYTAHTCSICGDSYISDQVSALGHSWTNATCAAPKTCNLCGTTEGKVGNHIYVNGFCTFCDGYEPAVLKNGYYEISNAGQLYWFAAQVNSGNNSINGKLMNNIVINENVLTAEGGLNGDGSNFRIWTPIGSYDSYQNYVAYCGTFDGSNHTISGLYTNVSSKDYIGLIGRTVSNSVVCNLGVVDSYLLGGSYVGGVVGDNNGTVSNCYNAGTVSGGGVVGYNNGTVSNCYNAGTVSGGGVVVSNYGTVINCYNTGTISGSNSVGGVIGYNRGTASNCYNTGTINGSDYVGGVVGYSIFVETINGCYNTGSVSGSNCVGGIAGYIYTSYGSTTVNVNDCHNTGTISGDYRVGGVVGHIEANCSNNSSSSKITVAIDNCYNTGTIYGTNNRIGGIVGLGELDNPKYGRSDMSITNCYNTGSVSGSDFVGGIIGENTSSVSFGGSYTGYSISVETCYNLGTIRGNNYVGGIAGQNYSYNSNGSGNSCTGHSDVSNCFNIGAIVGNEYVGGVVGYNYSYNMSYYDINYRYSSAFVSYCYNIGAVSGANYVGGVVGDNEAEDVNAGYNGSFYFNSARVDNCYYLDTCVTDGNSYGSSCTDDQMKTPSTFHSFSTTVWELGGICNYNYPALKGIVSDTLNGIDNDALGHSYSAVIIAPTCSTAGYTTYTCSVCGDSYVGDEVAATGAHNYSYAFVDSKHTVTCSGCHDVISVAGTKALAFKNATLSLASDISVIFKLDIDDVFDNVHVVFEVNGIETPVYDYTIDESNTASKGRKVFAYQGINPQMMGDNIRSTLYVTLNGVEISVTYANYSVLTYCNKQFEKTDAAVSQVCANLLNYGAAVQLKKGYKTDALVNANLFMAPSEFPGVGAITNQQAMSGTANNVSDIKSVALQLSNKVEIKVGMVLDNPADYEIKVTIKGNEYTYGADDLQEDGGRYYLYFSNLNARDFDETITFVILKDGVEVSRTLTYSVNSYIARNGGADTADGNTLRALYCYGKSTEALSN